MTPEDGGVEHEDPRPTFGFVARTIQERHADIAFIQVLEPCIAGADAREVKEGESNDFLREVWKGKPYIAGGGFNRESAIKHAKEYESSLVSLGRWYTSNVSGTHRFSLRSHLYSRSPTCPYVSRRIYP